MGAAKDTAMDDAIEVRGLVARYDRKPVLEGLDLSVPTGRTAWGSPR